jgi:hypothetical protein
MEEEEEIRKKPTIIQMEEDIITLLGVKLIFLTKLLVRKKRKNIMEQAEEIETESEDMELEINLDNVFCIVDQPGYAIHHNSLMEIAKIKFFYEDESFIFQSIVFYSESKNLIIEKRDVINKKGKYHSNINLRNVQLSQIS